MTTARTVYRTACGRQMGRNLYVSSTTTGTSTVNEIVDTTRTEFPAKFDGATIYFPSVTAPKSAVIRGSDPTGRIFLDSDLGSVPAPAAAYEIFVGYTLNDYDDAIDWAHAESYPHLYLAVNSISVTETAGTSTNNLDESWRSITQVRRQIVGSSAPVQYQMLSEGNDYFLRTGTAGIVYEANYETVTGTILHFVGKGVLTLATGDSSASVAPAQVIVPGALHYLYAKGSNADELALGQKFEQKAKEQLALFERAKNTYRMRPQRITASFPRIDITNDGTSVEGDW